MTGLACVVFVIKFLTAHSTTMFGVVKAEILVCCAALAESGKSFVSPLMVSLQIFPSVSDHISWYSLANVI